MFEFPLVRSRTVYEAEEACKGEALALHFSRCSQSDLVSVLVLRLYREKFDDHLEKSWGVSVLSIQY